MGMNSIEVAEAIERFANKVADALDREAYDRNGIAAYTLTEVADKMREAGKTNRTRRREERERAAQRNHATPDKER